MAFDDNYNDYDSEYDAYSSASESSFEEGGSEHSEDFGRYDDEVERDGSLHDIEYLTPNEMMAKLREDMSGYIGKMQEQMSSDVRVIAELNARAASAGDPAAAAMYMTVAAELEESINTRLEIEVNSRLAQTLEDRKYFYVGGNDVSAVRVGYPDPMSTVSVEAEDSLTQKYYALKDENGNPMNGREWYENMCRELRKPVYAANAKRIDSENAFYEKFAKDFEMSEAQNGEENTAKISENIRNNINKLANINNKKYSKKFLNTAILDRCENLRNIGRAMLEGGSI